MVAVNRLAAYAPDAGEDAALPRAAMSNVPIERIRSCTPRSGAIVGLQPSRAGVILAGALYRQNSYGKIPHGCAHGKRPVACGTACSLMVSGLIIRIAFPRRYNVKITFYWITI